MSNNSKMKTPVSALGSIFVLLFIIIITLISSVLTLKLRNGRNPIKRNFIEIPLPPPYYDDPKEAKKLSFPMSICNVNEVYCAPLEVCKREKNGFNFYCACSECIPSSNDLEVCGSNGYTFESLCKMNELACRSNITITKKHWGKCTNETSAPPPVPYELPAPKNQRPYNMHTHGYGSAFNLYLEDNESCAEYGKFCHKYGYCLMIVKQDIRFSYMPVDCTCPVCIGPNYAACASDGNVYNSVCEIYRTACISNISLHYSYLKKQDKCVKGAITENTDCEIMGCSMYSTCGFLNEYGPVCKCLFNCNLDKEPVCGTNGKSYINLCYLQRLSCMKNANITKGYDGPCQRGVIA